MSIPETLLMSALGMSVVFLGLLMLFLLIKIISFVVGKVEKKQQTEAAPAMAAASAPEAKPHLGVDLIGVEPREAACIMAIVSDESSIPLNELRFISIKAL